MNKPSEAEWVLRTIEESSGLQFCLKFFSRKFLRKDVLLAEFRARPQHETAFCREVKKTANDKCIECDLRWVPARASRMERVFVQQCHAKGSEIIIPVMVRGTLIGCGYLGQFRMWEGQPEGLPWLSREQVRHVLSLGILVQKYLEGKLRESLDRGEAQSRRGEQIIQFMQMRLKDCPSLQDLAEYLELSVSRTAHVVREDTGESFQALLDRLRIRGACDLLETTFYKIDVIAKEVGIDNPGYFYRFFRKKTGLTPSEYRQKFRREA